MNFSERNVKCICQNKQTEQREKTTFKLHYLVQI